MAIIAGPVFVFLYTTFFQHQSFNIDTMFSDTRSLLFLIVFYPVVEELAFRGVIQEFIHSKTKRYDSFVYISLANILTSILFVSIHFIHHSPTWATLVFIPSLVFGYFKDQYNRIGPSIFLHMFYNTCSLFMLI